MSSCDTNLEFIEVLQNIGHDSDFTISTTISEMKEVVITLTAIDTGSDVYIVFLYYQNGLTSDANTLLAMIASNLFVQLLTGE